MKVTEVWEKNWYAIHAIENGQRKYRYIINQGSSRSSKTFSLIDCFDLYARENPDKRLTVWRDTKTDCKKTVLIDVLKRLKSTSRYLIEQDFNKTESIFQYYNGSTFEIHGTDDEDTVHGLSQDAAWLNEPYNISREVFDQIDQRTSDFIFVDMNPKKSHWVDDLAKDSRTLIIHSTIKDNPFCPPEQKTKIYSYQPIKYCDVIQSKLLEEQDARKYDITTNEKNFTPKQIKELVRCIDNEEKNSANDFNWCVYGLGIKGERPNRIFRWKPVSDKDYRAINVPIYYGVDWGAVDPWGIVEVKYIDGSLFVHELNYLSENQWREKISDTELSQINAYDAGKEDKTGIVIWLFNKLGLSRDVDCVCDTNRPLKGLALRQAGYRAIPSVKFPGSVIDGIDLLNNLQVYYTESSTNLEYEQENYSRKVDRFGLVEDEPEDSNNHLCDPTRYVALYLQSKGIIRTV